MSARVCTLIALLAAFVAMGAMALRNLISVTEPPKPEPLISAFEIATDYTPVRPEFAGPRVELR